MSVHCLPWSRCNQMNSQPNRWYRSAGISATATIGAGTWRRALHWRESSSRWDFFVSKKPWNRSKADRIPHYGTVYEGLHSPEKWEAGIMYMDAFDVLNDKEGMLSLHYTLLRHRLKPNTINHRLLHKILFANRRRMRIVAKCHLQSGKNGWTFGYGKNGFQMTGAYWSFRQRETESLSYVSITSSLISLALSNFCLASEEMTHVRFDAMRILLTTLADDIHKAVTDYRECVKNKPFKKRWRPCTAIFGASGPLKSIAKDILAPLSETSNSHQFVLVMTNRYMKFVRAVPTSKKIALHIASLFMDSW